MIMITAIIYILFILCDIWSTVENYFQKILSPPPYPEKIQSPLFANIEDFSAPLLPCRKGGKHYGKSIILKWLLQINKYNEQLNNK